MTITKSLLLIVLIFCVKDAHGAHPDQNDANYMLTALIHAYNNPQNRVICQNLLPVHCANLNNENFYALFDQYQKNYIQKFGNISEEVIETHCKSALRKIFNYAGFPDVYNYLPENIYFESENEKKYLAACIGVQIFNTSLLILKDNPNADIRMVAEQHTKLFTPWSYGSDDKKSSIWSSILWLGKELYMYKEILTEYFNQNNDVFPISIQAPFNEKYKILHAFLDNVEIPDHTEAAQFETNDESVRAFFNILILMQVMRQAMHDPKYIALIPDNLEGDLSSYKTLLIPKLYLIIHKLIEEKKYTQSLLIKINQKVKGFVLKLLEKA